MPGRTRLAPVKRSQPAAEAVEPTGPIYLDDLQPTEQEFFFGGRKYIANNDISPLFANRIARVGAKIRQASKDAEKNGKNAGPEQDPAIVAELRAIAREALKLPTAEAQKLGYYAALRVANFLMVPFNATGRRTS